jgi:serine/threonine protein kinase
VSNSSAYRIVRQIGDGQTGPVFLANTDAGQVAIRQFRSSAEIQSEEWLADLQHFLNGGRQAAQLHQVSVVETLEVIDEGGDAYIATEFVTCDTLDALVIRETFPSANAASLLRLMAVALDFAHQHGVTHGDLKPSNVFMMPRSAIKISDFAISFRARRQAGPVPPDLAHPFLSPEHLSNPAQIGPRSDQYALAAIAWLLYTGRPPFLNLLATGGSMSAGINAALSKALSRDPRDRYGSCLQFVDTLDSVLAPVPAVSAVRKKPSPLIYAAIGCLVATVLLGAMLLNRSGRRQPENPSDLPIGHSGSVTVKTADNGRDPVAGQSGPESKSAASLTPAGKTPFKPPKATSAVAALDRVPSQFRNPVLAAQSPSADIILYSRENPVEQGKTFAISDPDLGEMALGDLKAVVRTNASARKEKLTAQWLLDGRPTGPPQDVTPDQNVPYRNEPTPGKYTIILQLNGSPWKTSSFTMTK